MVASQLYKLDLYLNSSLCITWMIITMNLVHI
jgi:hypothetical protein